MGWFDSDAKTPSRPVPTSGSAATPSRRPTPPPSAGSTIGKGVYVEGAIAADEDLTIQGKVKGTIHARQRLVVAAGAEVQAKIQGRSVEVAGKVKGDVAAADAVLLRPTAELTGNIETPSLSIQEGAFFLGGVRMQKSAPAERVAPDKSSPAQAVPSKSEAAPSKTGSPEAASPEAALAKSTAPRGESANAAAAPAGKGTARAEVTEQVAQPAQAPPASQQKRAG